MAELELSAGVIEYEDSGGPGPVLVLLGGLVMDGSVWDPVVEELRGDHRCVVPTLPLALGWMSKRPLPDELVDRWLVPAQTQRGVRRDLRKYAASARRGQMLEVCERLRSFDRPALVVWTPEDRVQRPEHGRRLAELLPDARLVEIPDSYTLIMRDQPLAFAEAIRRFVREAPPASTAA